MSNRSQASFRFELKAVGDDGTFEGYASTFGNVDQGRDMCMAGCFAESLKQHSDAGTMPGMFWGHNSSEPIGEWLEMREDSNGLVVKGKLWLGAGIQKAEQAYLMLKSRGPKGLSIGYITDEYSIDEKAGVRRLEKLDLKEVSVVTFPMNERARITSVKGGEAAGALQSLSRLAAVIKECSR